MIYKTYTMENALEAIIDYRGKTPKKADTGIPALSAKSVKNNYIDYNACYYISPEEYKRFMVRGKPQKGDILLTTEAPMGMVACLDRDDVAIAQRLLTLRGKENILDNNYLLYYLQSPIGQALLRARETGTTVTGIKQSEFKKIQISIPDIEVQRKIGTILRTIDKKIVVNESINRNLLEQLDALYDNWFGKYKPFNIGIGGDPGYALEDGWQIRDIYSIAEVIYGAPFTSKKFNTEGKGKPIVRIRDLKNQELCTYTPEEHPKGYLLQPGDIVVGMDGEFRPYIWGNEEAWLNQRVCVFNNVRKNGKAYVYCTIKPLLYSVETTEVATTVIHIGKKDYDEFRVVLPPEDILVEFEAVSKPIFDRIVEGQLENRRLTKLRNGLLPKLMSGELDVSYLNV